MDKIERLINLTAYLLETRQPVTLRHLSETVYSGWSKGGDALRRMFERDKEELRDMGVDVETFTCGPGEEVGYMIPRDRYYLPHLDLDAQERVALMMVSRLFLGSGTPFSGPAQSAMLKLAFDEGSQMPDAGVGHLKWVGSPGERGALGETLDGLIRRKLVTFSYRSLNARKPIEREVEPYGLLNRHGNWYLIGRCRLRGEIRSFKLERMTSDVKVNPMAPRTPDFEVPREFSLDKTGLEWPLPSDGGSVVAKVAFEPRLSFAFGSGSAVVISSEWKDDGSLEVDYEVGDPEQFVEWVLEFGIDARILDPPELRRMARERIEGALSAMVDDDR